MLVDTPRMDMGRGNKGEKYKDRDIYACELPSADWTKRLEFYCIYRVRSHNIFKLLFYPKLTVGIQSQNIITVPSVAQSIFGAIRALDTPTV